LSIIFTLPRRRGLSQDLNPIRNCDSVGPSSLLQVHPSPFPLLLVLLLVVVFVIASSFWVVGAVLFCDSVLVFAVIDHSIVAVAVVASVSVSRSRLRLVVEVVPLIASVVVFVVAVVAVVVV